MERGARSLSCLHVVHQRVQTKRARGHRRRPCDGRLQALSRHPHRTVAAHRRPCRGCPVAHTQATECVPLAGQRQGLRQRRWAGDAPRMAGDGVQTRILDVHIAAHMARPLALLPAPSLVRVRVRVRCGCSGEPPPCAVAHVAPAAPIWRRACCVCRPRTPTRTHWRAVRVAAGSADAQPAADTRRACTYVVRAHASGCRGGRMAATWQLVAAMRMAEARGRAGARTASEGGGSSTARAAPLCARRRGASVGGDGAPRVRASWVCG